MLIENEFFDLYIKDERVFLYTKKIGYPLKSFDLVMREHPRIKIQSFPTLRKALTEPDTEHAIGTWLPLLEIAVSSDKMTAQLIMNATLTEIDENRKEYIRLANEALDEKGIIHGRKPLEKEVFLPGEPIAAAMGTSPVKGADAAIEYIQIPEKKPVIRDDGSADYYEMNFVTPVKEGEWLGEKIPPQEGKDGSDVFGNTINATRGQDKSLSFEKKSVHALEEEDKFILRAVHGGALEYVNGAIGVGKHLTIEGDVGPETGSVTFDGAVTVKGTVLAGFSVIATGDISIEGKEGVTNSKFIQSSEGDVYIKGGIFGGGESIIEALGTIFIKHANNCKLYAKEVHAGLYILGSDVIAEHVFVDKNKGKIIGGHIEALFTIECAIAGNSHERTTFLQAKGIDKELLLSEIQAMARDLKERQEIVNTLEGHLHQFEDAGVTPSGQQAVAVEKMNETIESNRKEMFELDHEIQIGLHKIKTAIPAKIEVTKEAHAGTIIKIGNKSSTLHNSTKGVFALVDGVLNV